MKLSLALAAAACVPPPSSSASAQLADRPGGRKRAPHGAEDGRVLSSSSSSKCSKSKSKSAKVPKSCKTPSPTQSPTRLCPLIQPEPWDDVGVQVTPVGSVPVVNTAAGSYNMLPIENFDDLYVVDQVEGLIYRVDDANGDVQQVFDAAVMEGELDFDIAYPEPIWNGGDQKVSTLFPGRTSDEVIIVFQTAVVPATLLALGFDTTNLAGNTNADLQVPTDDVPGDGIYRIGEPTSGSVYKTFYKFSVASDGTFVDGVPFFSYERARNTFGHDGGGGFAAPDGRILVPVGDCLPFGQNGRRAAQDPDEHCGKILLIDPEDGTFDVAAAGVRNCQQINNYQNGLLYLMDIGGITSEEVNVVSLDALLDTSEIENFGWGMREGEDFAREGTFKVEPGTPLVFAGPVCVGVQTPDEAEGFVKPWFQYGRGPDLPLFGITSAIVSDASFNRIKLATTEFNTGKLLVADEEYEEGKVLGAFDVPVYDENMVLLTAGFNNLTAFGDRNDPRLFLWPDGTAGLFLERTGAFFRLAEI